MNSIIILSILVAGISWLDAQRKKDRQDILTILHFNDSHAYWLPHDRRDWGGLARMATKIKELKESIPNQVLVMLGGDMLEGRFYNRCGGGACDLKILDAMGVDYAVIGNHDWLIGPYNQYFSFTKARAEFNALNKK